MSALLHLVSEVDEEVEALFDRWSDAHVVSDLEHPGFLRAHRYRRSESWAGAGRPWPHLTLYELETLGALSTDAYRNHDQTLPDAFAGRIRYARSVFEALETPASWVPETLGPAIFQVVTEVEPGYEERFHDWYAGEHVPAVLTAPGVLGVRLFRRVEDPAGKAARASRYTSLALYALAQPEAIASPEALAAGERTPCPSDLAPRRDASHQVYGGVFSAP